MWSESLRTFLRRLNLCWYLKDGKNCRGGGKKEGEIKIKKYWGYLRAEPCVVFEKCPTM